MSSSLLLRALAALALVLAMIPGPAEACDGCCPCGMEPLREVPGCDCGGPALAGSESCDTEAPMAVLGDGSASRHRDARHEVAPVSSPSPVPLSIALAPRQLASAPPSRSPDLLTLLGSLLL